MEEQKPVDLRDIANRLIIEAGKNRKIITGLKSLLVKNRLYDLASELREYEKAAHPMPAGADDKYKEMQTISDCLRMAGLAVDLKSTYIVTQVYDAYKEMKGNFDLDTATKIQFEAGEIFGIE